MSLIQSRLAVALSAFVVAQFGTQAALAQSLNGPAQSVVERLAPQDRQAFVARLIEWQQRQRSMDADATLDVAAPVFTSFNSASTLNLSKAAAPFKFVVKATDDLSGVPSVYAQARGPSGQTIYGYAYGSHPVTNFVASGGFSEVSRLLEPGTWKFVYAYGFDVAGNYFEADETELAALGNTSFTVVNKSGHDLAPPALASGKIMTASVSLSAHAPGTSGQSPSVGVKLTATDVGNTALSGVRQAYVYLCQLADPSKCIYLYGYVNATGLATATFSVTAQVSGSQGNVPGDYELKAVYVFDFAGNSTTLLSNKFGGSVDFAALFPTTVIKLKP